VGSHTLDELLEDVDDTLAQSLLEKAGLARPQNLPKLRTPQESPGKARKQIQEAVDQAMKNTKEQPKKSPHDPTR
jgi:hypothetical protein